MRVLFLPDYTDGNPYQEKLAEGLQDTDIEISMASGYPVETLRSLLDSRPNVIHLHWIAPFLVTENLVVSAVKSVIFLQATLVAKLFGIDTVWTVHNLLDHERRHPRLELLVRRIYARLSDRIIVHCPAAKGLVERRYRVQSPEKIIVVPHGHYDSVYKDSITQEEARTELSLGADVTTFLYFGQIRTYKQVPQLVDTFKEVSDPDLRLVVAGKPVDEAEAQRVSEKSHGDDRIDTELEFIPNDRLQVYFNAADAVVLPYRNSLTSGTAILGMSFGTPIVGPRVGCLPGLLDHQDELLYDPDTGLQGDSLRRAASTDLASIGTENRRQVLEYEWDTIASQTQKVYEST